MNSPTRTNYQQAVSKWIRLQPTLERWCKVKKIDYIIYQNLFEEIFGNAKHSESYKQILNQFFDNPNKDNFYLLVEGKRFYSGQIQEHLQLFDFFN